LTLQFCYTNRFAKLRDIKVDIEKLTFFNVRERRSKPEAGCFGL